MFISCVNWHIISYFFLYFLLLQEKDFDFEDSEVIKIVKRSADDAPLISDDEDLLLADEPGSTPDEEEGSGTLEPPVIGPVNPGLPSE